MTDDEKIILAIAMEAVPAVLVPVCEHNHCILATRCAIEVLKYFDVTVTALPVRLDVFNNKYVELYSSGALKTMNEEEMLASEAWALTTNGDKRESHYAGHLVCDVGDSCIIDFNFGQLNRPAKNMEANPAAVFKNFDPSKVNIYTLPDFIVFYQAITDESYKTARDWKKPYRELIGQIIRRMKEGKKRDELKDYL